MSIGSEDRRVFRRKTVGVAVVLVAVCAFSLCVDNYLGRIAPPLEVLQCYGMWFNQLITSIVSPGDALSGPDLMRFNQSYFSLTDRAAVIFITAVCGMLLALSGSLYQSVFRNPIASPSMLGVSSGVQLGVLVLVVVFGTAATTEGAWRYALCYTFGISMLVVLFVLSHLISGRGQPLNVVNMLVIGTLLSQLAGVVVSYVSWYYFDDELWEVYNSLSEVLVVDTEWYALAALAVFSVISVAPILLLRFRMNMLSFGESDMRMLGVSARSLQIIALICGTVVMVVAQVSIGTVAMLALVVPHISRMLFGAEFRKQLVGNVLLGALLLVTCRTVLSFVPFIGSFLPIGTVVSFLVIPAFVWILATQQRSWE